MNELTDACMQISFTPNQPRGIIKKCLDWLKKAEDENEADLI